MKVLYVGSGAVNLCLAGWMHSGADSTTFLVRTSDNEIIRKGSFQVLLPGEKNYRVYTCKATSKMDDLERPDLVVIGVKCYSLEAVVESLLLKFGKEIPVLSVLNGVKHVELLSAKFERALFATITFNAYRTSQGAAVAVGGSAALSGKDPNDPLLELLFKLLKRKIRMSIVKSPMDAAHCKLAINLGNSVLTIVGYHEHRNRELPILLHITANIIWEGVRVIRKHAIKEAHIPEMPPWILLWLSAKLPSFLILPIFREKMKTSSINSMAQDLAANSANTELEDINGYLINLADRYKMAVPYNRAVYHLFKDWLESDRQPLKPSKLLSLINSFDKR